MEVFFLLFLAGILAAILFKDSKCGTMHFSKLSVLFFSLSSWEFYLC